MAYAATALTYIGYALIIGSAIYSIYMMNKGGGDIDNLAANSLDDFNITRAEEGMVAPLQYGRAKITGNVMWHGNFTTVPIVEKVDSGKKSQNVITGYNYYLDVWQALGHGQLTILRTWVDEEEKDPTYNDMLFNDGTEDTYPTQPGEWANAMTGLSSIFFDQLLLGENVQSLPTIHWLTERLLTEAECPLDNLNVPNAGVNPAAIVYDLLRRGSASTSDFNVTAFQAAADYWYNKGYGLNIIFNQRVQVREAIKTVLKYVGATFGRDEDNKFYINALNEADTSVATLSYDDGDFVSFKFQRKTWDQCNTDFVGTYKDEDQEYTNRTVKAYNPAVARIIGKNKPRGIDMKAFRTLALASKRIWEIMKEDTYPYASIECEVPMRFYALLMGQVVTVNHSKYGIADAEYRVMQKDYKDKDKNTINLLLRQNTESLWDSNYRSAGGSAWVPPEYTPTAPYAQRAFQLPYSHVTGEDLTYLLLVARRNTYDLGYSLYRSLTGTDYTAVEIRRAFAQYGTLDAEYPETIEIDETIGITYTPYAEDPAFDTIDFDDALQGVRMALIEEELIGFATVTLNDDGSITLTDCIRGMFGTGMDTHAAASAIWLFSMDEALTFKDDTTNFFLKFVPYTLHGVMDIASCPSTEVDKYTPINVEFADPANAANTHVLAPMVYWNRSGPYFIVYPRYKDGAGAGFISEEYLDIELPTNLPSNMKVWYRTSTSGADTESLLYTTALASSIYPVLYVRIEVDGRLSPYTHLTYSAANGTEMWYPKTNDLGDTSVRPLARLLYGAEHWSHVMDYNAPIIEEQMKLNNFLDVSDAGLTNLDRLMWDETTQKFIPVEKDTFTLSVFDCSALQLFEGAHGPYNDGSITASSWSSNTPPEHAFDGGNGTLYPWWQINDPGSEVFPDTTDAYWWQINLTDHGEKRAITCFRFYSHSNSYTDRWPKTIRVEASDTGSFAGEETILYTGDIPGATTMAPSRWSGWASWSNSTEYVYYRIYILDVYTYDSGGHAFYVAQIQFMEKLPWPKVQSIEVDAGVANGSFSVLQENDDSILTLEGIDATPAFDADFYFEGVTASDFYFRVIGYYQGDDAHVVRIQAWNYNTLQYDYITSQTTDFENRTDEAVYMFGPIGSDYVSGSDEVRVQIVHETAGDDTDVLYLDQMVIVETTSSTTTSTTT